jgi:hypothetical protein
MSSIVDTAATTSAPVMTPESAPASTTTTLPPVLPALAPPATLEPPGWTRVASWPGGIEVDQEHVIMADGAQLTLARFWADQVRFDLHVGSSDPPTRGIPISPDGGPAIGPGEAQSLLGAFNGGFMISAGVGGFEVGGQVLSPLVDGMASFILYADGTAQVAVWGQTFPASDSPIISVRQNLPPLIVGGRMNPQTGNVGAWGATLGGGAYVARSALGEDAAGDLIYAGSMSAVPLDLANALAGAGATSAMQLDINPAWVQLDLASIPGDSLSAAVPGQNRPSNQYQVGWTRDFVTVMAVN